MLICGEGDITFVTFTHGLQGMGVHLQVRRLRGCVGVMVRMLMTGIVSRLLSFRRTGEIARQCLCV